MTVAMTVAMSDRNNVECQIVTLNIRSPGCMNLATSWCVVWCGMVCVCVCVCEECSLYTLKRV